MFLIFCSRRTQTFQDHAAAVAKLLNQIKDLTSSSLPESTALGLGTYVIAVCFPKMLRRITSKYSTPFLDTLKLLSDIEIQSVVENGFSNLGRSGTSSAESARRNADFVKMLSDPFIAKVASINKLALPNLMQRVHDPSLPVYTSETCREFHRLLVALLEGYMQWLQQLNERYAKMTSAHLQNKRSAFQQTVKITFHYLSALRTVTLSSALSEHLERFQVHLDFTRPGGGEDEEEDSELIEIQPRTMVRGVEPLSVSSAYMRWFRLQVTYLESAALLTRIATKSRNKSSGIVSVKVIAIGHAGKQMHPWRKVIRDTVCPNNARPSPTIDLTADEAISLIDTLASNNPILAGVFSRLSTGETFSGSEHCETCLASLFYACPHFALDDSVRAEFAVSPGLNTLKCRSQ
jgi:hypothetical protein